MRQLLLIIALVGAFGSARAAENTALKTNSVALGTPGTLQILSPSDWTFSYTNLSLPDNPLTVELHSPQDTIVIRFYVRWDGFGGATFKPTEAQMGKVVSNNVVVQYLPVAVEQTFDLEKLYGPAVTGIFARVTDSKWTPVAKNTYPNITEGMFRCSNIWGNFNLLTHDKNGPEFNAGMKILESMRRKP